MDQVCLCWSGAWLSFWWLQVACVWLIFWFDSPHPSRAMPALLNLQALSAKGRFAITASDDNTARVWDLSATARQAQAKRELHEGRVRAVGPGADWGALYLPIRQVGMLRAVQGRRACPGLGCAALSSQPPVELALAERGVVGLGTACRPQRGGAARMRRPCLWFRRPLWTGLLLLAELAKLGVVRHLGLWTH